MTADPVDAFAPSGARGAALDLAVRRGLARSLRALSDCAEGLLPLDAPAIAALAEAVERHPVRPAVMASYTACVLAIAARDEAAATQALAALADPGLRGASAPRIVTLTDEDLGPGRPALYHAMLRDDPESTLDLIATPPGDMAAAPARIAEAMTLLGPGFEAEIRAVAPEILLVRSLPGMELEFQGATSFHLWGCFALNLRPGLSPVALAGALAHESGHAVLYGLTLGGRVVTNPDSERHPSPLRIDPRPLEGIAHAAWVLARMHLAMETILGSGRLDAAGREEAEAARQRCATDYEGALATMASARFTPAGEAAFAPASAYMAARGTR